ncbi:MAG: hypothetical protein GPJ50_03445, partial [Candidatus Heimdallarchaeota archaeon]|nr:hypothetical protein [Candidatus Heimdallarchaeota archaeon]
MTTFPVEATLDISHSIISECGIEQEGTLDVSHSLVSETTLQIEKVLDVSHSLIGETSQELERALDILSSFDGAYNVKQENTWIIDETTNVDLVLSHALSHEYGISKICDIVHSFYGGTTYKLDNTWLISKTLDIDLNPLGSLKYSLVASCDINSIFSGIDMIAIDAIMDITPEIQSVLNYDMNNEDDILHECIGNREYTLVITPHSPPNILSYRATAEWHADYDIAEVRFRGIPSFEVGDYIQIEQEDYYTPHNQWVIFRGVAIGLDKTYKKNFEETTVNAVSNDWYLTKQFCFWEEQWTENLSFLKDVNGMYYVKFFLGGLHYWS